MANRLIALDIENENSWTKYLDTPVALGKWDVVVATIGRQSVDTLALVDLNLKNYRIGNLPVLHTLAGQRLKEQDASQIDTFIKLLIDNDYDINQSTDNFTAQKRSSLGFTALLAAVEKSNMLLIDLLIKNGADANIRDKSGFSPCHWAVLVGNLTCLHKLIQNGADVTTSEEEKSGKIIHPVLHTAVDEGRTEIVYYLIEKNLVNINEPALYRGILSENSFTRFPSRYNCVGYNRSTKTNELLEVTDVFCTPLGRAVRMRKISIIEILLKHNARPSGLDEWHFCILEGDTEVACLLAKYVSNRDLAMDKISGKWALHCLHNVAFLDETRTQFTAQIIQKYVDAHWNINAVSSNVAKKINFELANSSKGGTIPFAGCTLLHIACLSGNLSLIQFIVEKGANLDKFTGAGGALLNALHISLILKNWDIAIFLMEKGANITLEGQIKRFDLISGAFTSLELLLKIGDEDSLRALNVMLESKLVWDKPSEFHASLEGGNPLFVSKVFECVKDNLSVENLCWVKCGQPFDGLFQVPCLSLLLQSETEMNDTKLSILVNLLEVFVKHSYNFNAVAIDSIYPKSLQIYRNPLIFHILDIQLKIRSTLLLETLLKFEHVRLNVRNVNGLTPIQYLLFKCNMHCFATINCWKPRESANYFCKAVKLLVHHGADVTNLVIGKKMKYHYGYQEMIQMLYCAGANIEPEFFQSPVCHPGYVSTRAFHNEVKDLEMWVNQNNRVRKQLNLEFLIRMRLRQNIQTIGDLKALEELPRSLKEKILCIDFRRL